jgi:gluconolactonase
MLHALLAVAFAVQSPAVAPPVPGLVAAGTVPKKVASGLRFTEGPAADAEGRVFFTDVPANRILVLKPGGDGFDEFLADSKGCNGLMFAADGSLWACQGNAGRLVRIDPKSKAIETLAESLGIDGKPQPLGRVNDLTIDAGGGVYFTDPAFGRPSATAGVLYRDAKGELTRVDTAIELPNGVLLSPDGKMLYVLSSKEPSIHAFAVLGPGKLGERTTLASLRGRDGAASGGIGDGLAVDARGNLWCTNPKSSQVQVFSPQGSFLGAIDFPEAPSNCAFGGDGKTLFVTAQTGVYTLATLVEGHWVAKRAK